MRALTGIPSSKVQSYKPTTSQIRGLFLAVLAVLIVGISIKYASKALKPGDGGALTRSAFLRWRAMIHEVFAGENIYIGANEYPNPPIMAIILYPFALLPPLTGALVWFYAKVAMAAFSAVWLFRLISPSVPDSAKALAILLSLPALFGDLSHGNVNIFILFLLAGCLEAYRRRWDGIVGLVLALAIACKVMPIMLLAYFVWKRSWAAVTACVLGLGLWLFVIPGMTFGWQQNTQLLESWYALMVERPILKGEITTEHANQAVQGVGYRLLTHSPSFIIYPDNIPTPAEYHNLVDIGRPNVWVLVKGLLAAFALAIMLLCRQPRNVRQGGLMAAEVSLILLGMLLFSERTWKHHAVTLLLPVAIVSSTILGHTVSRKAKVWLMGLLVIVGLLIVIPSMLAGRAADMPMVYGAYFWAFVLLSGMVGWVLYTGRQSQMMPSTLDRLPTSSQL